MLRPRAHSLLFFSLFCSFSTTLRSCPDGLGRLVLSLASFLVLPFRAEASVEETQVKQQRLWTHLPDAPLSPAYLSVRL